MIPPDKQVRWIAAAVVLLSMVLLAVESIVTSHPSVCAVCHRTQAATLASSLHSAVTCYDCHLEAGGWSWPRQKADELLVMYPRFLLLGRRTAAASTRVSRAACLRCHSSRLDGITMTDGLRVDHSKCAAPPAKCDECHGDVGHPGKGGVRWQRDLAMDSCMACHGTASRDVRCEMCHTDPRPTARLKAGETRSPHPAQWDKTHGMAGLRGCIACHADDFCVRCHGVRVPHPDSFLTSHGKAATARNAKCSSCHPDPRMCDTCHGIQMPHPKDFLSRHAVIAASSTDPACLRCHRDRDCERCHVAHTHPGRTNGSLGARLPTTGGGR